MIGFTTTFFAISGVPWLSAHGAYRHRRVLDATDETYTLLCSSLVFLWRTAHEASAVRIRQSRQASAHEAYRHRRVLDSSCSDDSYTPRSLHTRRTLNVRVSYEIQIEWQLQRCLATKKIYCSSGTYVGEIKRKIENSGCIPISREIVIGD